MGPDISSTTTCRFYCGSLQDCWGGKNVMVFLGFITRLCNKIVFHDLLTWAVTNLVCVWIMYFSISASLFLLVLHVIRQKAVILYTSKRKKLENVAWLTMEKFKYSSCSSRENGYCFLLFLLHHLEPWFCNVCRKLS